MSTFARSVYFSRLLLSVIFVALAACSAPGSGPGGVGGSGGGTSTGGGANCPFSGRITYTLAKSANPTAAEQNAYNLISVAMNRATSYYNCYTNITKHENVSYLPSVATADGNINGSIRFGSNTSYMDYRNAMHEIAHTLGIGQASNWRSFVVGGLFTGATANAQLRAINQTLQTPLDTQLHADSQHFWPYGINQASEVKSEADLIAHCKIVSAIRVDLGLR
jgi:stress-induced morphogen